MHIAHVPHVPYTRARPPPRSGSRITHFHHTHARSPRCTPCGLRWAHASLRPSSTSASHTQAARPCPERKPSACGTHTPTRWPARSHSLHALCALSRRHARWDAYGMRDRDQERMHSTERNVRASMQREGAARVCHGNVQVPICTHATLPPKVAGAISRNGHYQENAAPDGEVHRTARLTTLRVMRRAESVASFGDKALCVT